MIKSKKYKVALASLITASAISLSAALAVAGGTHTAFAEPAPTTLDGSNIFYTDLMGAEITYSPEETVLVGETQVKHSYVMFSSEKDENVYMRNSLAYKWLTNTKGEDDKFTNVSKEEKFSLEIGFPEASFERYILKFQSQQFSYTEKKVSENYFVFYSAAEGTELQMAITDSLDNAKDNVIAKTFHLGEHIKIEFGNFENGNYDVKVNGDDTGKQFKNVSEYYAKYETSSTDSVTPITFSAEFAENAPADSRADMVLYSLNGQGFELKTKVLEGNGDPKKDSAGNVVYDVKVVDDTAPALCFKKTPSYIEYGKNLSLEYEAVDVLTRSPRTEAYYYVLSGDLYAKEDFDYDKFDYEKLSDNPFTKSGTNSRIIRGSDTFIPTINGEFAEDIYGLVKVYIKVSDSFTNDTPTDYVFANWYVKDEALVDIYQLKNIIGGGSGITEQHSYFLKLIDENGKEGATYADKNYLNDEVDVLEKYKETVESFQNEYQTVIDNYIKDLVDDDGFKGLYAGGDSKFYLPSLQPVLKKVYGGDGMNLFDDYCSITDYKYTIYYKGNSTGTASSLNYNKLAIDLKDANTNYRFTIYATDAFGNPMRYPESVDESGEIVWKKIEQSDVWDEEYDDLLPRFTISVKYKEATAKNPGNLSLAYVGTTYNGVSFDIKGASDTYTANYKLYVFDRNAMYKGSGNNVAFEQFNDSESENSFTKLFADENTRKYFTTVKPASELLETDENYELFKEINWNKSNATFTPLSVEDFYVVELTLTDKQTQTSKQYYTTVAASKQTTPIKGDSEWVENNLTSIILLSVAGACLIALVLLFVLKPKDKGDIDTIYIEEEEKKAAKAEKKKQKKSAKENA